MATELQPVYVRPRQAARLLSISLSGLYKIARRGALPIYRVGGARLHRMDDVLALAVPDEPTNGNGRPRRQPQAVAQ